MKHLCKELDIKIRRRTEQKKPKTAAIAHGAPPSATGLDAIANGAFDDLAPPPVDKKCNGMLLVFLEASVFFLPPLHEDTIGAFYDGAICADMAYTRLLPRKTIA